MEFLGIGEFSQRCIHGNTFSEPFFS